jgi:hypothetical protein
MTEKQIMLEHAGVINENRLIRAHDNPDTIVRGNFRHAKKLMSEIRKQYGKAGIEDRTALDNAQKALDKMESGKDADKEEKTKLALKFRDELLAASSKVVPKMKARRRVGIIIGGAALLAAGIYAGHDIAGANEVFNKIDNASFLDMLNSKYAESIENGIRRLGPIGRNFLDIKMDMNDYDSSALHKLGL